jgi:glycosyltransferase involved in cell wall biosynthesis
MSYHPGRFSIALCTYNGAKFLMEQLESYCVQSRLPDELVVCDDQSTDSTAEIVAAFRKRAPFPVHFHRQPVNLGSTRNFEDAIGRCSGEWIFLSDQDDCWLPHKMEAFAKEMRCRPEVRLIASDADVIDDRSASKGYTLWSSLPFTPAFQDQFEGTRGARLICWQNMITGATAAFHASLVPLVRPIPPSSVHDAWIALLAAAVVPCGLIREPLIRYRQHAGQQIGAEPLTFRRQLTMARRMNQRYFDKQVEFFGAAYQRLANVPLRDAGLPEYLREKTEFSRLRSLMRTRNRIWREVMVIGQALRGRYHRLDKGFKAMAVDALL